MSVSSVVSAFVPRRTVMVLGVLAFLPFAVIAAENAAPVWQPYDESDDLALLAEHPNESMHFQLLAPRVLDKNTLWQPFERDLANFGAARYEALKPLILDQPIAALQAAVSDGRLSYEALTTFYLYRIRDIEADNSRALNAIIALNPAAIDEARALDAARARGASVAPDSIYGIPVLLKDNVGFAGLATTAGALALRDNVTDDAFITARLKANHAIILGKTNLSEWAYFFCDDCPSGYSGMGGQTLNPYGRFQFGTGGSSAGTGAAIAANYATIGVGSETSGSILSPSSANSLVGLKPTTGNLSRSGVVPISATLDTAGPMGHSVADVVTLFNAMTGYDQADTAMPLITEDFRLEYRIGDLAGKRLGVLPDYLDNALYTRALSLLTAEGAVAIELVMPDVDTSGFDRLLGGDMVRDLALYLEQWAADGVPIASIADLQAFNNEDPALRAPYGQALIDMMAELDMDAAELEALTTRLQTAASQVLDGFFIENELDLLLSINNFNAGLAALANYPALTIPMGYSEDGRPMGLTFIAPTFREQDLIDLGAAFERLSQARRLPADYQ